jgi:DNA-binding NarL/FixJ family response regulator
MDALDLDSEQTDLRSALGAETYQAAWSRGRSMTVEEALADLSHPVVADRDEPRSAAALGLTPREFDVLRRITAGMSNREIANELFISTRTVERHIENLYRKLDIHSRTDAVDFGRSHLS